MTINTSIDAAAGRMFTMKVSDGNAPPTFLTIGGGKSLRLSINGAPVEISNSASGGWKEYLPGAGLKEMTASLQGIFDSKTVGARKVWDAAFAVGVGGYIEAQIISGHGDYFVGVFVVESYERSGDDGQAEQFSCTLKSHGQPSYVAAP
ncbi:phage tail tube protein [Azospirillum rugosum]|uniref:Secreted protein n=1 Tax=Azospirillum rugosum TaxID=416170 RepID=A0ABS4SEQ0_9PROT|nr:phage tail tube protein [Azospirillum rugosum]MBP2291044.1 putative secreted protein [Azospirillum rugosum]MDQ0524892.1 putative secreted protein [Azospirillum rugosum]